jgi:hypothetical protein
MSDAKSKGKTSFKIHRMEMDSTNSLKGYQDLSGSSQIDNESSYSKSSKPNLKPNTSEKVKGGAKPVLIIKNASSDS